jgi:acetylornithine deacetylase/succinyl-diaminopimelate desuccinylase-like protein
LGARETIDLLTKLLSIKSISGKEHDLISFLNDWLTKANFLCELVEVPNSAPALIARRGFNRYALCTHADTVNLDEGLYINNGAFFGTGAADAKGQLAALLLSVKETDLPATVIITVDEELEGKGSRSISIDENIKGILVLEPTDFTICTEQAGAIEIKVRCVKQPFHASCSDPDNNPAILMSKLIVELHNFRMQSPHIRKWNLPTVTPYYLHSGREDLFASPAESLLFSDIPIGPEENPTAVLNEIIKITERYGAEVIWAEVEPGFSFSASSSLLKNTVNAFEATFRKKPRTGIMPSWTDAANFALSGIDTLVFGAGKLSYAHTNQEHILVEDIIKLTQFIGHFLRITANESTHP